MNLDKTRLLETLASIDPGTRQKSLEGEIAQLEQRLLAAYAQFEAQERLIAAHRAAFDEDVLERAGAFDPQWQVSIEIGERTLREFYLLSMTLNDELIEKRARLEEMKSAGLPKSP